MAKIITDTKVLLEFLNESKEKGNLECHVSTVEKDRLHLRVPKQAYEYGNLLKEGTAVKGYIYTYSGILVTNSVIIDQPQDGYMTIEFKEEEQIIQHRQYFRIFNANNFYLHLDEHKLKAQTIDLSGGGIRFYSKEEIMTERQYDGTLVLTNPVQNIPVAGRVFRRSQERPNEYVMEFTAMDERERERIIKYCVMLERERNKKY